MKLVFIGDIVGKEARETFIKKNKAGKTKNVFSCQLNEI